MRYTETLLISIKRWQWCLSYKWVAEKVESQREEKGKGTSKRKDVQQSSFHVVLCVASNVVRTYGFTFICNLSHARAKEKSRVSLHQNQEWRTREQIKRHKWGRKWRSSCKFALANKQSIPFSHIFLVSGPSSWKKIIFFCTMLALHRTRKEEGSSEEDLCWSNTNSKFRIKKAKRVKIIGKMLWQMNYKGKFYCFSILSSNWYIGTLILVLQEWSSALVRLKTLHCKTDLEVPEWSPVQSQIFF